MISTKLVGLRSNRNISQERLAEVIGVTRQSVAKWESGESVPEIEKLVTLSYYYGVSVDSLVKEDQDCGISVKSPYVDRPSEFRSFLCRAKKATYAGHGNEVPASRVASHDLEYAEGKLRYYDTYLGGELFAGQEGVWDDDTPIWAMNYCGRVLDESFSGEFLKESLGNVDEAFPYRGPLLYQNGDFTYHCAVLGDLDWFSGTEEIYHLSKKIYELVFHGGKIK